VKIAGHEFKQGEQSLFAGTISAKILAEKVQLGVWKADVWHVDNPNGYQRSLNTVRAAEFGRYVSSQGLSPVSILINFREGAVRPTPDGHIELPDGVGYLVDGQHRAEGVRLSMITNPDGSDYEIPIIVMNMADQYQEAKQFVIINRTQKGVKADLAERFLAKAVEREGRGSLLNQRGNAVPTAVLRNLEWTTKAITIADSLNTDPASPWYKQIRLPNEPRGDTVVAQKAFTDSLEPILKDNYFVGKDTKTIAAALRNYWNAIKTTCSDAFDTPADFAIQKTNGVGTLHKVFPRVSEICVDTRGNRVLTVEMIRSVLALHPHMNCEYWENNGEAGRRGTGKKAVFILAMEFMEELENIILEQREHQIIV
jgi:DGQHR domain-containing protein